MSDAYQEYPCWMKHPHAQPAIISDAWAPPPGYPAGMPWSPPVGYQPPPGKPATFPPVQVQNRQQEEMYAARGYERSGKGSAALVSEMRAAPMPPGYEHQEWPRIVGGILQQDPGLPPENRGEYPKWARENGVEKLVADVEQERAFRSAHKAPPPPPSAIEAECMAALQEAAEAMTARMDERDTLLAEALGLGLKVDRRWKAESLKTAIEEAQNAGGDEGSEGREGA